MIFFSFILWTEYQNITTSQLQKDSTDTVYQNSARALSGRRDSSLDTIMKNKIYPKDAALRERPKISYLKFNKGAYCFPRWGNREGTP